MRLAWYVVSAKFRNKGIELSEMVESLGENLSIGLTMEWEEVVINYVELFL